MIILNQRQIQQKIKRMAIEIFEAHADESTIVLAGINSKGLVLAHLIAQEIEQLSSLKATICNLSLNPAEPLKHPITLSLEHKLLKNKVMILVDDVLNTGRTMFFGFKPIMDVIPKKVEICVLIERMHKSFPIRADYVGMKLATTIKQNIEVYFDQSVALEVQLT
ncbi:MAG TPA: phosphoribosyltransferase family protein [Saprospiraceae bacterium]|nr:phosphoribosyltransferase family protein [Saprospiraceae bacterium]